MRKPNAMPLRRVPILPFALIALAACARGDDKSQARTASGGGPIAVDGAVVGGSIGSVDAVRDMSRARRELSAAGAPPPMDAPAAMDERAMTLQSAPAAAPTPTSMTKGDFASANAQRA